MAILAVENLDIIPFKGMNKTFRNGTISFVAGANNSYKTLLIKVLSGIVKTEEKIRVNRTFIEQITTKQYPYQIQTIFEDDKFKTTTVKEEIILTLIKTNIPDEEFAKTKRKILSLFQLTKEENKNIKDLNKFNKIKLSLACAFIYNPKIMLVDDIFKYLTEEEIKFIAKIFKEYKDKIKFICMTNNLNVPLCFDEVDLSILDKGKIVKEGDILSVLDDDSMLNKLGFRLPFMIDLSLKLKYYNLVDKIILNQKEMVEMLWK